MFHATKTDTFGVQEPIAMPLDILIRKVFVEKRASFQGECTGVEVSREFCYVGANPFGSGSCVGRKG